MDLISNYGQLTMEEISGHANTYINADLHQAQNIIQINQYIYNTLIKEVQTKIPQTASLPPQK